MGVPLNSPRMARGRYRPQLQAPRSENTALGPSPRWQGSTAWGLRKAHSCLAGRQATDPASGSTCGGAGDSQAEHRWMDKTKGKRKATEGQAIHTPLSEDEETGSEFGGSPQT